PAPLAVLAVPADTGQALGEHAAYVVVDRRVEPRRAQGAGRSRVPSIRPGPEITVATATGSPRSTAAAISPSSGNRALSIRSTKMSMIPPQVSPTANASSSLTP